MRHLSPRTPPRAAVRSSVVVITVLSLVIPVLSLVLGLAGEAEAQTDGVFIYGLTLKGKLTVNGTVLDSLSTKFDDDPFAMPEQRFGDLNVTGSRRRAFRRDGILYDNGKKILALPFLATQGEWVNIALQGDTVYAIRQDGSLSVNNAIVAILPTLKENALYPFSRVIFSGTDVYSLRADGEIYKNGNTTPTFDFKGGNGLSGRPDGLALETVWIRLLVSPADGDMYALRADGVVFKANLPPANATEAKGALVAKLPFPLAGGFGPGDLYVDFDFAPDGKWHALRANGQVYNELMKLAPLVDYPGNGGDFASNFQDFAFFGADFWALRGDGHIFKNTSLTEVIDLPSTLYSRLAISADPPDLTKFKNSKPVVSTYGVTLLEGTPLSIPVIATDSDKRSEDLTVTAVDPLPPGSTYDPVTRTLTWDSPGPVGKYVFVVLIDDGVVRPKAFKYPIKVIALDPKPEKNKPPVVAKIKPAQALVGYEIVIPIIADDPDGDPLTISTDTSAYPFTSGATFDPVERVFRWTPAFEDVGKLKIKFFVSDGVKTKKLTLSISVVSPLIF